MDGLACGNASLEFFGRDRTDRGRTCACACNAMPRRARTRRPGLGILRKRAPTLDSSNNLKPSTTRDLQSTPPGLTNSTVKMVRLIFHYSSCDRCAPCTLSVLRCREQECACSLQLRKFILLCRCTKTRSLTRCPQSSSKVVRYFRRKLLASPDLILTTAAEDLPAVEQVEG